MFAMSRRLGNVLKARRQTYRIVQQGADEISAGSADVGVREVVEGEFGVEDAGGGYQSLA